MPEEGRINLTANKCKEINSLNSTNFLQQEYVMGKIFFCVILLKEKETKENG